MTDRIEKFLDALNDTWRRDDLTALADFYHPQVVMLPPDLETPIVGRDAVVASYRDFSEAATLLNFSVTRYECFSFAQPGPSPAGAPLLHMVHMYFDVGYRLQGSTHTESGLEIYTLLETGDALQIVWRCQTVLDSRIG